MSANRCLSYWKTVIEAQRYALPYSGCLGDDFVHDPLAIGRKIRILAAIDTVSRYVPVSYKGEDVVATLDRVCRQIGHPDDQSR